MLQHQNIYGSDCLRRSLSNLTRLSQRRQETREKLEQAIESRLDFLGTTILEVAVETGDPIGSIFASFLARIESTDLVFDVLRWTDQEQYWQSVPLREVALVANEKIVAILELVWQTPDQEQQASLSRLYHNLAIRQGAVGLRSEALETLQKAIQIRRNLLAQDQGGGPASNLAESLGELGIRLRATGDYRGALAAIEEALEILRQLPESSSRSTLLSSVFNNLGLQFLDLGHKERSKSAFEEAVLLRRNLANSQVLKDRADLAMSLSNLGLSLYERNSLAMAQKVIRESVEIYRELVSERSDIYNPFLASCLNNLGLCLHGRGRLEKALVYAQKAVEMRARLVVMRPAVFLPDLAESLTNLGMIALDLGFMEKAKSSLEKAVEAYSELMAEFPEVFSAGYLKALMNLSAVLFKSGHMETSLEIGREALRRAESLHEKMSGSAHFLAGALHNMSLISFGCQHYEAALLMGCRAVEAYRDLTRSEDEGSIFMPDLALALYSQGTQLFKLDFVKRASQAAREAAAIYQTLSASDPSRYRVDFESCLKLLKLISA